MRKATVTLEQAAAMMRKKQNGRPLLNINAGELIELIEQELAVYDHSLNSR